MSRLIFKGDTVQNFGEFLPTPFIERIYVEDTVIKVDISLFMLAPEDEDQQQDLLAFTVPMLEFYLYLQPYLANLTVLDPLLESVSYTSPLEGLISGDENILEYIALSTDSAGALEDIFSVTLVQELIDAWKESTGITALDEDYTDADGATWEVVDYLDETYTEVSATLYDTLDEWLLAYYSHIYTYIISPSVWIQAQMVSFDISSVSSDIVYDDNGNLVIKLSSTTMEFTIPEAIEDWTVYEDVAVFAVSTTTPIFADLETLEELRDNVTLLDNIVSEVSYESIFEGGDIVDAAEQIWVDPSGNPFDGVPLQEIMATYHKPTKITHKDIVDGFEDLLSKFETLTQIDSTLENAVDSVSYVLAVYGTEPDLLPQLNKLRKAWPSKSSVTHTGKLYHAFKRALFNASKVVGGDPILFKQLVLNPKIIDQRFATAGTWALRELYTDGEGGGPWTTLEIEEDDDLLDQYNDGDLEQIFPIDPEDYPEDYLYINDTYPKPGVISAETFYTADQLDDDANAEGYGGEAAGGLKVNGFFFLDVEKLIARTINIGQIYPPEKLDSFFGPELIQSRIGIYYSDNNVKLYESGLWDTGEQYGEIAMYVGDADAELYEDEFSFLSSHNYSSVAASTEDDMETSDSEELSSYYITRNFTYPATEEQTLGMYSQVGTRAKNEYRLLGLEFQMLFDTNNVDVSSYAGTGYAPDWYFETTISFLDETMNIYTALRDNYYACYTGSLQEYYDVVSEPCNYNENDGTFNEFFIDGILATYEDNTGDTPWYRAAYLYCLHRDLLFNSFGGDIDLIMSESLMLADKIGPYAGTLDQVEAFKTVFEALYDEYYDPSEGTISQLLFDYDSESLTYTMTTLDTVKTLEISDIDFPYIYDTTTVEIYTGQWWAYFDDIDPAQESTSPATYTLYESAATDFQLQGNIYTACGSFFDEYDTDTEYPNSLTNTEAGDLASYFGELFVEFWNGLVGVTGDNDITTVDEMFEAAVSSLYDDAFVVGWMSDQGGWHVTQIDKWYTGSTVYDELAYPAFQLGMLDLFMTLWYNYSLYTSMGRPTVMEEDLTAAINAGILAGIDHASGAGVQFVNEIKDNANQLKSLDW